MGSRVKGWDHKPDRNKPGLLHKIMIRATSITVNVEPYEEVPEVILATQMYGIAEKYIIRELKDLSVSRSLAEIEKTSVSNLLALIDIINSSTLESDNLLRKWVVWQIQVSKRCINGSMTLLKI